MTSLKICLFVVSAAGRLCLGQISVAISDPYANGKLATITNTGWQPITALAFSLDHTPYHGGSTSGGAFYFDGALDSHDRPIPPGGTISQEFFFHGPPVLTTLELKAALFEDGSSYGDPTWVARLVKARQEKYQSYSTAIERLSSYPASTELSVIVNDFRMLEQQAQRTYQPGDLEAENVAAATYSDAAQNLGLMGPPGTPTATRISRLVKIFVGRQAPLKAALGIP